MKSKHLQIVAVTMILMIVSAGFISNYTTNTTYSELTNDKGASTLVAEQGKSQIVITEQKTKNNRKRGFRKSEK